MTDFIPKIAVVVSVICGEAFFVERVHDSFYVGGGMLEKGCNH
jgi:hypothetical protein